MKRTAIKRSPIRRGRVAIKREGVSTLRWKQWRTKQYAIARGRARNKCEYHAYSQLGEGLELNHLFGRLDEPWSSYHPFTLMMCLDAHRRFHADAEFRNNIQWDSLAKYMQYSEHELRGVIFLYGKAINLWRFLMDDFKKQGVLPPDDIPPKENRAS